MRRLLFAFVVLFVAFFRFSIPSVVNAQSCAGRFYCYQDQCSTTGERCNNLGEACGDELSGIGTCVERNTDSWPCVYCASGAFAGQCSLTCGGQMTTNCDRISNGCIGPTYPTPPPTNEPTPPPGTTCSGTCFAGIANCGAVGYDSASGTCNAGELCCQPRGTGPSGNCCYDGSWADANAGGNCDNDPEWTDGWYACNVGHDCSICSCTPSCTPACGQANGCGGTCPTTDDGAPATPDFTVPSVASGQVIRSAANGQVTLTWTPRAKAESYRLELHPSTDPAATPGTVYTTTSASYSFTPTNRYYSARIRAVNTSCGTDASAWSAYVDFQVAVPVSGNIYYDQSGTAGLSGNLCVGPTTPTPAEAGQLTVSGFASDGTYSDVTTAISNAFSLRLPYSTTGQNNTQLQIENSDRWLCSCPAGCSYPSGINAPTGNVNFYVLDATDPWFQAEGGPVAAYGSLGTVIQSLISPYCQLPACNPSLILNQNGSDTEGYALTGGGNLDTSFVGGLQTNQIDENGHNWFARLSDTPNHQDYTYFAKLLKLPPSPASDFGPSANNASKPTVDVANEGADAYFHSGDLTITDSWDVASDETVIVLVDGNVNVEAQTSVADGGYFMIVATGDIVFDAELGHDDPMLATAIVEGVFVANGQIRTPSRGEAAGGDKKFVGEGTFVGWSGFSLERDYDDGAGRRRLNNTAPVEYFRYRPDFLKNAPESIKRAQYSWRELNP